MTAAALVRYDEMCRAIDQAYEVDEVKDIRDKALAMEAYFRQAKNPEPERRACEIRLRAERKAGQLLSEMEKPQGRRTDLVAERDQVDERPTLSDLGISKTQSSRWQQLAAVPERQFEEALAAPKRPSTSAIISKPKQEPMNPCALWLWGRLRDFERESILDHQPAALLDAMTDAMRADVRRLVPLVREWLEELELKA